jgi:hypothetical protein
MMTGSTLTTLAHHEAGPHGQVISLYLDQSGRTRPRPDDVGHAVDGLLREARTTAESLAGADRRFALDAIAHLAEELARPRERVHARGLATFADQDGVIGRVAAAQPFQDGVSVGLVPDLRQLLAREHRARRFLVVLVDHVRARLLDVLDGEVVEEHDIVDPPPRAVDRARGGRSGGFQAAVDAAADRHVHHVDTAISDLLGPDEGQRLVLGGVADAVEALANRLPAGTRRALVEDRLHVPVMAAPNDVLATLQPITDGLERTRLQAVLDDAHAAVGRGHAGLGLGAALRTLDDRRTELVVIGDRYRHAGLVCRACGALFAHEAACTLCGERTVPVDDVVDHVIVTALRQHARVELVPVDAIPWPDPVATIARF